MYKILTLIILLFTSTTAVADLYFYTDKNGVRHFTNVPSSPEFLEGNSPKGNKNLSEESKNLLEVYKERKKYIAVSKNVIRSINDLNNCLATGEKCRNIYYEVIDNSNKWLESKVPNLTAKKEIKLTLLCYENYFLLMGWKDGGLGEGSSGYIRRDSEIWSQFINAYPSAEDTINPNLEDMMKYILEMAMTHSGKFAISVLKEK